MDDMIKVAIAVCMIALVFAALYQMITLFMSEKVSVSDVTGVIVLLAVIMFVLAILVKFYSSNKGEEEDEEP
jgi:hypothetical protein